PKAFELSAGFLRISNGDDPLDTSGVHPEAYSVVRRILAATNSQLGALIGNTPLLRQLEPEAFTDAVFGVPTVTDILSELEKPGRDPRPVFKTASFREGVEKLEDVKPGMVLEGVVTNVAAFGAFVDVGVHQDGWCTSPRWPILTSPIHARLRRPAMSSESKCWRSTRNAVGSRVQFSMSLQVQFYLSPDSLLSLALAALFLYAGAYG